MGPELDDTYKTALGEAGKHHRHRPLSLASSLLACAAYGYVQLDSAEIKELKQVADAALPSPPPAATLTTKLIPPNTANARVRVGGFTQGFAKLQMVRCSHWESQWSPITQCSGMCACNQVCKVMHARLLCRACFVECCTLTQVLR